MYKVPSENCLRGRRRLLFRCCCYYCADFIWLGNQGDGGTEYGIACLRSSCFDTNIMDLSVSAMMGNEKK